MPLVVDHVRRRRCKACALRLSQISVVNDTAVPAKNDLPDVSVAGWFVTKLKEGQGRTQSFIMNEIQGSNVCLTPAGEILPSPDVA